MSIRDHDKTTLIASRSQYNSLTVEPRELKDAQRAEIQKHIDSFLDGGGTVKVLQCITEGIKPGYPDLRFGKDS